MNIPSHGWLIKPTQRSNHEIYMTICCFVGDSGNKLDSTAWIKSQKTIHISYKPTLMEIAGERWYTERRAQIRNLSPADEQSDVRNQETGSSDILMQFQGRVESVSGRHSGAPHRKYSGHNMLYRKQTARSFWSTKLSILAWKSASVCVWWGCTWLQELLAVSCTQSTSSRPI